MASDNGNTALTMIFAALAGAALLFVGFTVANNLNEEPAPEPVQVIEKRVVEKAAPQPDPKVEVNLPDTIEIGKQEDKKKSD